MEMGGLRADVNVSIRRRGEAPGQHQYDGISGLGQRTEIKNLSSFKAVEDAIIAEKNRQIEVLESGGVIEGETRGWTIGSTETRRLRGKEGSVDYRYMPDPDIPPLIIGEDLLSSLRESIPTAPDALLTLLVGSEFSLPIEDAKPLIELDNGARLEYYHDVVDILRTLQVDQDDKTRGWQVTGFYTSLAVLWPRQTRHGTRRSSQPDPWPISSIICSGNLSPARQPNRCWQPSLTGTVDQCRNYWRRRISSCGRCRVRSI